MKKKFLISFVIILFAKCMFAQNQSPVAVNDTITGFYDYPVYVTSSFLLKNDYDPDGDSIKIKSTGVFQKINDSTYMFVFHRNNPSNYFYDSIETSTYLIEDEHGKIGSGKIIFISKATALYDSLDINNINAMISPFGNHFWDGNSLRFIVPKRSGKQPIFCHSIWVGGKDSISRIYAAAETNRYFGTDFYTGPISALYDSSYFKKWNRVWKLDKDQIRYHINNYKQSGYKPIDAIANWPAHGNPQLGQSTNLAPYYDFNLDGSYTPMQGDYPLIPGDQAIYFILNDIRSIHTESNGRPLGVELHGIAYEFDKPEDSTLNNSIFFHYEIVNLSGHQYDSAYIGLFNSFNLGDGMDDYVGTDVTNGMIYVYNADSIDGAGEPWAYGEHPPAFGLKVIGGPYLEPDGLDNPPNDCSYALNGLNFGDGITDNERMGLCVSMIQGWVYGQPFYMATHTPYQAMEGFYNDEIRHMKFGDPSNAWSKQPDSYYVYPGSSDTICNWGTRGIEPVYGYNQNGKFWNEETVGNNPGYREMLASVGPFTLHTGQSVPLDYCFTWARDYHGDNYSSVELLRERIAGEAPFWNQLITPPTTYYGVEEPKTEKMLSVYPNPAHTQLTIFLNGDKKELYGIYTINGLKVSEGILSPGTQTINIAELAPGVYVLKCGSAISKLIKL